ncbi:hypothetical protein FRB95_007758 [Tulasnella sp. JGI-2019a]|nr:hypothetical protein FRB95_007758 [Tulasnella sp. JGI-2019a]
MAYITQLLLFLCSFADYARYTLPETDTLIDVVTKVQAWFVTDVDVMHALGIIKHVISKQSDTGMISSANLAHRFNLVSSILTRALGSTSHHVSDAACGVLAAFGDMAWEDIDTPRIDPGLLIVPRFGFAALRSLGRTLPEDWVRYKERDRPLSRWLAASIRSDTALAITLDEFSITSLFLSRLPREQQLAENSTIRNIAYLFLKRWHATTALDPNRAPEMTESSMRAVAEYTLKYLSDFHHDTIGIEMFVFIAAFIQQAFLLRPAAAAFFGLDLACEGLIQRTKVWEEQVARSRDVFGADTAGAEAELATLVPGWMKARRAYAGASHARDETLRYANYVGWWKYGGLCKACDGFRSAMA